MKLEDFFNQHIVIDLSFFNFRNAITGAYFANKDLEILKVNENFRSFFPVLGNVTNAYFPDVLEQLGVPGAQIENFVSDINEKGCVLIPAIHISIDGTDHVYSLLSTRTHDDATAHVWSSRCSCPFWSTLQCPSGLRRNARRKRGRLENFGINLTR